MIGVEREAIIIEKLRQLGKVMVNELAEELQVTTMTIRRDLQKLERQGLLQKVHGGAVLSNGLPRERSFGEKKLIRTEEKQCIAREALKLVAEGDTILLDAGTTTFELAELLKEMRGVHVVTSDLHIAMELCAADGKLFFIGGEIEKDLARSGGAKAFQFLSDIHVDTVFLGVSAISDDWVLGSHTIDNAELKRAMLTCGSRKALLADKSKFGVKAFTKIGPLSLVDALITEKDFNEGQLRALEAQGVALHRCGKH